MSIASIPHLIEATIYLYIAREGFSLWAFCHEIQSRIKIANQDDIK